MIEKIDKSDGDMPSSSSPSRKTKRKEAENSYCVTLDDGKVITLSNIFVEKGVKMHHSAEVAEVID